MIYLTLSLTILFAVLAIFLQSTLLSVLSLAIVSALLSIAFFQIGAPVAGVFELSVGAGLITVLIVLTITFIQTVKTEKRKPPLLWVSLSFTAAAIFFILFQALTPAVFSTPQPFSNWSSVGNVLWKERVSDLLPQGLIILSAVFGILTLLREDK